MSEKSMAHHLENHESEKHEAFEAQQEIMRDIYENGFAKHVETISNLPDAFDLEKHKPAEDCNCCVCCMDGRTPFGIHSAGSGMLLSEAELDKYLEESKANSISSHTGCGAAKLYCKAKRIDKDPDEVAKEWAKEVAERKGLKYVHLEVDKPFHYERVCYYDGTGKFNYSGVDGLPAGFVISRKNMTKDASLAEAGVAKDIIFGDHGFGAKLLNEKNPFIFVAVGETEEQLNKLMAELEAKAKEMGGNIKVDGFVAPSTRS